MLSRRSVRVKVMQELYSLSQDKDLTLAEAVKAYHASVNDSFSLYLLNVYCLLKICGLAADEVKSRQTKFIKSDDDHTFSDKLFTNELITNLYNNAKFQKQFAKLGFPNSIDHDLFKNIYREFSKEEAYKNYLNNPNSTKEDHIEILLELYRCCRRNELFNEIMDDRYGCWQDDKSLVIGALKKTLKALPAKDDFYEEHLPDDETVKDLGEALLKQTSKHEKELMKLIEPILENWESERLAVIDVILIKMGMTEIMYFPTIPTKVTLNEYVELAKAYSTDKSKDFVNGILDKLLRKLIDENKITKEGRGLVEE